MRIGIIAHVKHPIAEPFAGGLEAHTALLATRLRERGHKVTVFASTRSEAEIGVEPICDATSLNAVGTAEATDESFFREHHAYLDLMQRLRQGGFDVIHNNSLHYLPVAMADVLPMPMVTTLHTPPFCWLESGIRLARHDNISFVAVSKVMTALWRSVVPGCKVISNGIDLKRFSFQAEHDPAIYMVWQGRLVPEKGAHHAIAAAKKMGIPLKIAGPALDQEYFDREVKPHLGGGIKYEGHLAQKDIAALVGKAAVLLNTPGWDEPYGLVVAEALACGVPVAAFDRGAMREILTEECGVLAQPDNAEALAQAAKAAMALSRHACRHRAETACDAETMVTRYEKLYYQLTRCASATASPPAVNCLPAALPLKTPALAAMPS
ncbi:MAG: glycosyltransferase [Sphingobium sp.]